MNWLSLFIIALLATLPAIDCTFLRYSALAITRPVDPNSLTFERVQVDPIILHGSVGSWYERQIFDSQVFDLGTKLRMYTTGMSSAVMNGETIGIWEGPRNQPPISWSQPVPNPIIRGTLPWEHGNAIRLGSVVKFNGKYVLFYTAADAQASFSCIGRAESVDGITFSKYSSPVMTISGDENTVETPAVIEFPQGSGVLHMYYGWRSNAYPLPSGVRHAKSTDGGYSWTKLGTVVNRDSGRWDSNIIEWRSATFLDGYIFLFYEAYDGSTYRIGYAYSSDGIIFTKCTSNPVFSPSTTPGAFDSGHVATPSIFLLDNELYLFYIGTDNSSPWAGYFSIGLAKARGSVGPDTGVLRVFASYNGTYIITSVTVTGPQNVEGMTTTDPSPLSFSLTPGTYLVSGNYFAPRSESVAVVKGQISDVTLNFGGPLPPPPPELPLQLIFVVSAVALVAGLVFFARRRSARHFSISRRRGKHRRRLR